MMRLVVRLGVCLGRWVGGHVTKNLGEEVFFDCLKEPLYAINLALDTFIDPVALFCCYTRVRAC